MDIGVRNMPKQDGRVVLSWLNMIGLTYFWSSVILFFYMNTFMYIPSLYKNDPETLLTHTCLSYFILTEVLVNYFLCIVQNSYFDPKKCAALPNSSWGKCLDCKAPKPPRTHHCPSCQRCVLKRDHHCFLTASCVGFLNMRYLVVYTLYSGLASLYTLYSAFEFVQLVHMPLTWETWRHFVLPYVMLEAMVGWESIFFVFHVAVLSWTAVTAVCGFGMCSMQLVFSISHMTQRDLQDGLFPKVTSMGPVCDEMRAIFGPWFLVNFVVPLFWLSPKGDGIHFTNTVDGKLI